VTLAAFLLAGVATLTACNDGDHTPDPKDTTASNDYSPLVRDTPSMLDDDTSQIIMERVYDNAPFDQQQAVCQGVNLLGHDWAVTALQRDVPVERRANINWDAAADYLVRRCAEDFG